MEGAAFGGGGSQGNEGPCRLCLLSSLSNKSLDEGGSGQDGCEKHRIISQRQYKRKLRRDCPSYVTLDRKNSKKSRDKNASSSSAAANSKSDAEGDLKAAQDSMKLKLISKTTFKLRSTTDLTDFGGGGDRGFSSGGEGDVGAGADSLELMEIPLSPTNYNQV